MESKHRLKKNKDFQHVFQEGQSTANRQLVVYVKKQNDLGHFRVGFSVSKKMGSAVKRNYIKRCLRQAFQNIDLELGPVDIIVIARKPAASLGCADIHTSLRHVLKKAGLARGSR
ncbi:ribonuclease P protein component [Bacillaceae bacterium SIJ1]|nr:ribonuclease P protein component [Litoribacterium kuwaitense]